jgi:hypothetical protein
VQPIRHLRHYYLDPLHPIWPKTEIAKSSTIRGIHQKLGIRLGNPTLYFLSKYFDPIPPCDPRTENCQNINNSFDTSKALDSLGESKSRNAHRNILTV